MSRFGREIEYNIRWVKPNDPYYWEVDNLPIEDLQENCIRLQNQILNLPNFSQFITEQKARELFVDKSKYNARRFEDFNVIDFSTYGIPLTDDVLWHSNPLGWHRHGYFKREMKITHQSGSSDSRGLEDVSTTQVPNNNAILRYDSESGDWTQGTDEEFSHVLNDLNGSYGKDDTQQSGNLLEDQFVKYNGTVWENFSVVPKCGTTNLSQDCILAYDEDVSTFTSREAQPAHQGYDNVPGQSGFLYGYPNGISLLEGYNTDSPFEMNHYAGTYIERSIHRTGEHDPGQFAEIAIETGGFNNATQGSTATDHSHEDGDWLGKLSYNTQGQVNNCTILPANTSKHMNIDLSQHALDGLFPKGTKYLMAMVWMSSFADEEYWVTLANGSFSHLLTPRMFLGFATHIYGDILRRVPTVVGTGGSSSYFRNRAYHSAQQEVLIPVNWVNGTPWCHVHGWSRATAEGMTTTGSMTGNNLNIPSFCQVRVDGWVT